MKAKTAETPILTLYDDGDYRDRAKDPWSCEDCITDYYEGDLPTVKLSVAQKQAVRTVLEIIATVATITDDREEKVLLGRLDTFTETYAPKPEAEIDADPTD